MRKKLIGAVSATALLLSGAAWAQSSGGGTATETERTTTTTTTSPSTQGQSESQSPGMSGSTTSGSASTGSTTRSGTTGSTMPGATASDSPAGVQMDMASAEQLLGKTVLGANGEEIGEVKDVILDPQTGEAKQLIVGSGGFLGIGQKNIPVDFADAQVQPGQEDITVSSLTREQVRDMEGYEYDESTVSLTRKDSGASGGQTGQQTERTTTTTTSPSSEPAKPKPAGD